MGVLGRVLTLLLGAAVLAALAAVGFVFFLAAAGAGLIFYAACRVRRLWTARRPDPGRYTHKGIEVEVIPPPREDR